MTVSESRVSIAGFGSIGREVARRLAAGVPGVRLVAVSARDRERAAREQRALGIDIPVVAIEELEPLSDIVVECAPAALLPAIAEPVLRAGKEIIVLSAGALLEHPGLIDLAAATGGRITVPTGALLGLDAVSAAAEGQITSIKITSRKPVAGLLGAPYLEDIDPPLDETSEPVRVFTGTAREAARGFPANLNVAVALALAGPGPDRTQVEVWADPHATRNTHTVEVKSDVADLTMTIENVPSENPRTGRIVALSVVSLLRKRGATLRVGS